MSFRAKLVGTWRLQTCKILDGANEFFPLTESPVGSLMYSSDGYMSSWVGAGGMPAYANGWTSPTSEEAFAVAQTLNAYTGKFYLDEKPGNKQVVYHEVRLAVPQNFAGLLQKRNVEIRSTDGKILKMKITTDDPVKHPAGNGWLVLEWQKESENSAIRPDVINGNGGLPQ